MPNRKPGAPEGNRNAEHAKPWADALRNAVLQYEDKEAGIGRGDFEGDRKGFIGQQGSFVAKVVPNVTRPAASRYRMD